MVKCPEGGRDGGLEIACKSIMVVCSFKFCDKILLFW